MKTNRLSINCVVFNFFKTFLIESHLMTTRFVQYPITWLIIRFQQNQIHLKTKTSLLNKILKFAADRNFILMFKIFLTKSHFTTTRFVRYSITMTRDENKLVISNLLI